MVRTAISCYDPSGAPSTVSNTWTNLTIGSTYYVRIFEYNSTGTPASSSTFQICVTHSGGNCQDNYEPNNSPSSSTAFFITPLFITATCNTEYSYIGSGDQDWYRILVDGTGTLKINLPVAKRL